MEEILLLSEASHFYSYLDEENFFSWLKKIPAVTEIRGTPHGLELVVTKPMDRESLADLSAVFTRYDLDGTCLKGLARLEDVGWFEDPGKYWHRAVFRADDD